MHLHELPTAIIVEMEEGARDVGFHIHSYAGVPFLCTDTDGIGVRKAITPISPSIASVTATPFLEMNAESCSYLVDKIEKDGRIWYKDYENTLMIEHLYGNARDSMYSLLRSLSFDPNRSFIIPKIT